MRIFHILDHSLPLQSGYTFRTAAILREQRALGWETVHMTTPRHGRGETHSTEHTNGGSEEAGGWLFHRTRMNSALARLPLLSYVAEMSATKRRILELAEIYPPDVLHAHSPVLNMLPALSAASRLRIPVIYEVRALWEDAAVDHGSTREDSVRYRFTRALESYALRRADHITTICEGLRNDIVARGIPADKVTVIPNAVDLGAFDSKAPADSELRRQLGLDGATVVGFAGSFYAYEGLDLLLEAFSMLASRHSSMRLLLVGGGPQEAALKKLATASGVRERVIFTGRVPNAEVQRYYGLIDVLAYPRHRMRLTEIVTPLKPLEAMAQGRMLVASDVGGHRELIRHGETGFLFPAGDAAALALAIESVLARRSEWPQLAGQAKRFVENERTWKRSVDRYTQVYANVQRTSVGATPLRAKGH